MKAIDRPEIDSGTPKIFTPEQSENLLKLCRKDYPTLLPWLALTLFAGLRPAEVQRLTWKDIDFTSDADFPNGFINIDRETSKTHRRRLVTIKPACRAWLEVCENQKGPIVPKDHIKATHKLRTAFGTWPRDVLRHSYVSYQLAESKDIDGTALEAGHSVDVLFEHYRKVVKPEAAVRFWAIRPEDKKPGKPSVTVPSNVVSLNAAAA